jgi:AmmeMemoRadiSam system protein A
LDEEGSAFVTLYCHGKLRGCVGMVDRGLPLGEAVVQAALGAARNDPRFEPIRSEELAEVEIEISVLSEALPIAADSLEVGRHGLLVIRGQNRGLLLPQVAAERSWSAQHLLEQTCLKAGLQADAWRDPGTELLAFTADVFSERELHPAAMAAAKSRGPSRKT